ncbi:MAG: hypothetical protein IKY66_01720 [Bacteroidales bacterium]|nr:hypothetical protein [Bacteroidales bacterium]
MMMYCPYCSQPIPKQMIRSYEGYYSLHQLELKCPSIACKAVSYILCSHDLTEEDLKEEITKLEVKE